MCFEVEPQFVGPTEAKMVPHWSTADGNDTMINLWNPISTPQGVVLTLSHSGGKHYQYPIHLVGSGSAMLSVKELQGMGAPDADGNVLPKEEITGSAVLFSAAGMGEEMDIVLSVGTFNVLTATCGTIWPNCAGYENFWVNPIPFPVEWQYDAEIASYAQLTSGVIQTVTAKSTWSSDNTAVASVVSAGTYYGGSPGTFNATAQAKLNDATQDCVAHGPCVTDTFQDGGQGTVTYAALSSGPYQIVGFKASGPGTPQSTCTTIPSSTAPPGGSFSWSNPSKAVTLTNKTSSSVQVCAVAGQQSQTAGDISVSLTYTVDGASATAATSVTLLWPTALVVASDPATLPMLTHASPEPAQTRVGLAIILGIPTAPGTALTCGLECTPLKTN